MNATIGQVKERFVGGKLSLEERKARPEVSLYEIMVPACKESPNLVLINNIGESALLVTALEGMGETRRLLRKLFNYCFRGTYTS